MAKPETRSPWRTIEDRQQERAMKREAVLRTAAQAFNEKGFHATSLDDVAERLNVTKPTLYYYLKNKDEILFECVRIGLERVEHAAIEIQKRGGSALDQLRAVMRAYAEVVTMDFGMCVIRVGEDPLPPERRKALRVLKGSIDRKFRMLIEKGIKEGALAPCDPKLAAFTVAGALSWIGRWYSPEGPYTPEKIADAVIGLLMNGLLKRPDDALSAVSSAVSSAASSKRVAAKRAPAPRRRSPARPKSSEPVAAVSARKKSRA